MNESGPLQEKVAEPILVVRDLSKTYNRAKDSKVHVHALSNVSFEISAGEFVSVVGVSGCGKSTLLHCVGSFEEADPECRSAIKYCRDGELVNLTSDLAWYRQNFIGVIFQSFHLLPNLRVWQNVEIPLKLRQCDRFTPSKEARLDQVTATLESLGLANKLNERINNISGGECQRVAIARALVKKPRLLLADEPTGNLDVENTLGIVRNLRELADNGLAVLMVTHNVSIAREFSDRIITLKDGHIIENERLVRPMRAVAQPEEADSPKGIAGEEPACAEAGRVPQHVSSDRRNTKGASLIDAVGNIRVPGSDMGLGDLIGFAIRDARESYLSLITNVVAILFGTVLTALLLSFIFGADRYMHNAITKIPLIDTVSLWVDYSTGADPISNGDFEGFKALPGARVVIPDVKQMAWLFSRPVRQTIAAFTSGTKDDPALRHLQVLKGEVQIDPDGWDVVLPERVAYELDNLDPHGLVGTNITMELRRYTKGEGDGDPTKVLRFPVRVAGIVKATPSDRVYASLNMVRFIRDYGTMRSDYVPESNGKIDLAKISARTLYEGVRVHFDNANRAESAFVDVRKNTNRRYDVGWAGQDYLYLRDVQLIALLVFVGIGLLTIIAGSISVFNTLQASVLRKTREIGILRALGLDPNGVFFIYMFQAVLLALIASFVGLLFSSLVIRAANPIILTHWKLKDVDAILLLPVASMILIVGAVIAICGVAAAFPSWRASQKTPMDAIREAAS